MCQGGNKAARVSRLGLVCCVGLCTLVQHFPHWHTHTRRTKEEVCQFSHNFFRTEGSRKGAKSLQSSSQLCDKDAVR